MAKTTTIYGKNALREVLKGNRMIYEVFIYEDIKDKELLDALNKKNLVIHKIPKKQYVNMFSDKTGGIAAKIEEYEYYELGDVLSTIDNKNEAILLLLANLEDPHNLGAILRTADATNIDGIIIPKNRSVKLNDTVAKVSTGAIEHVKVMMVTNLTQTINKLKDHGFWVIGLELSGNMDFKDAPYDGKVAIVVGSEGKGIPKGVVDNCDMVVKIPMYGKVNSLNASVSASLILYEAIRKRDINEKSH